MNASAKPFSWLNTEVHLCLLLAFYYGFTAINIPEGGGDLEFWSKWAIYIRQHGIRHIYDLYAVPTPGDPPSFLYGPVHMYLLYFWGKWEGPIEQIQANPYQFKTIILLFDVIGIWFALRYMRNSASRPFYAIFLLFNIGLFYNTISWGQVDGAIACFILIALYFALRGQIALSGLGFVLAFLIKPQPVIFLPVLGILWLMTALKKSVWYIVWNVLGIGLGVLTLLWPFIEVGTLADYGDMLIHMNNIYPTVTVNAGNIWTLLFTINPNEVSDKLTQFGLSYKQWGLLMFAVSYALILFPLLRQFYQLRKGLRAAFDPSLVLLTAGLVPIVFYFFNTEMHERYAHPSVLLLAAYALSSGDFIPYIIASVANVWVMDKFLKLYGMYTHISLELIAFLFLLVLVWGVVQLYRQRSSTRPDVTFA